MLAADDLVLCAGTLAQVPLVERIPIAAKAGFRGLSLFLEDLERAQADGHDSVELRARLADQGLEIAELDPLLSWSPGAVVGERGFARFDEPDFYVAAEAVPARSLNAVCGGPPASLDAFTEAFAGLCDRAAERGLLVHLEFMPFTPIADLPTALAIVDGAGRANGGIMFDVWHHFRSGASRSALERAASRVIAVQLDDAPEQAEPNLVEETLHRRLLPGEGDAGVPAILRTLAAGGCRAPLGVEVFSDALAALPPLELATRVADATRAVIRAARSASPRAGV